MKNLNMETARKRYNNIMYDLCLDHLVVGKPNSKMEEGSEAKGWNLRDMVSECQYQLDCHYEDGNMNAEGRYSEYESERKAWRSEVGKLQRFINAYKPFIEDMECVVGHCSEWD